MSAQAADVEWRTWLGGYEVSENGQLYSTRTRALMSPQSRHPGGYIQYVVTVDGKKRCVYAHALVLEVFVGPRPDGFEGCHIDGNPQNNHVSNLMWGSRSTNQYQRVAHGRHFQTLKTHCPQGHPYDEENTRIYVRPSGSRGRLCKACNREACRRRDARRRLLREAHCEDCHGQPDACTECPCHVPQEGE